MAALSSCSVGSWSQRGSNRECDCQVCYLTGGNISCWIFICMPVACKVCELPIEIQWYTIRLWIIYIVWVLVTCLFSMEWGEQSYDFVVPVCFAKENILQILEDFTLVTTKEEYYTHNNILQENTHLSPISCINLVKCGQLSQLYLVWCVHSAHRQIWWWLVGNISNMMTLMIGLGYIQ